MATEDLWRGPPLVLASTSRTRLALLEAAGFRVGTEAPGIDERTLEAGLAPIAPSALAAELASAKALAVSRRRPDALVIGADQVLACEGELFSKPVDVAAARIQIERLAGRTHRLHAAVAVAHGGAIVARCADEAELTMRPLDRDAITAYLERAGAAATRSVGAYEIEGLGIHLFERVAGAHSTILGLPMLPLLAELRRLGALAI